MSDLTDIGGLVRQVEREMRDAVRERLRAALADRPREWLVEQLLDLALSPALPVQREEADTGARGVPSPEPEEEREARLARIRGWSLDTDVLRGFVQRFRALSRADMERDGTLLRPPPKGTSVLGPEHRGPRGEELLCEAKDLLYALLFGDSECGVHLERAERELLTLTVPRDKAHTVAGVMRAATEIGAEGTWRDPTRAADDDRASNIVLQVEYGEVAEELVGNGIAAALRLINDLEVNEQVLYGRMENVEESTLT